MKKKVLIFIPEFPVITETFISREAAKLVERGNLDIVILSLKKGEGDLPEELNGKVVYRRLNLPGLLLGILYIFSRPKRVFDAFNLVRNPYLFIKSLGYSRLFSFHKPDIIYSHFLSVPSTIALAASKILGVELGISAHARDILENAHLVREKVENSKFITICNKNAFRRVVKLGGVENPSNVYCINHGVDEKDLFKGKRVEKENVPVVYSVGRLVNKKGLGYLIEASSILSDRGFKHKVYIAGPGPLYDSLKNDVYNRKLDEYVEILGGVSFDEILGFFKIADVFVLPSIDTEMGDADGIPNVLVEAALLGVPIVTTDAGGISEFISGQEGIVVPQKDPGSIADAVEKLIRSPDEAENLTSSAYKKAKKMFDLVSNVSKIERLLLQ